MGNGWEKNAQAPKFHIFWVNLQSHPNFGHSYFLEDFINLLNFPNSDSIFNGQIYDYIVTIGLSEKYTQIPLRISKSEDITN